MKQVAFVDDSPILNSTVGGSVVELSSSHETEEKSKRKELAEKLEIPLQRISSVTSSYSILSLFQERKVCPECGGRLCQRAPC